MNNFRMALSFTVAALALSAASMVQAQDSQSPVSEQDRRILQLEQLVEKLVKRVQQLEREAMGGEVVASDEVV